MRVRVLTGVEDTTARVPSVHRRAISGSLDGRAGDYDDAWAERHHQYAPADNE
jgi:hypothetical protein